MHLIDYGHMREGVLYHGTLSDLDGAPRATWTYEKAGQKVTHDQPIDLPTFRSLWNRIGKLDVFQRNRVRDPDRPVDPAADHVVSIIFGDKEKPQRAYFAIPAGENDPQFLTWLKSLNIPKGTRCAADAARVAAVEKAKSLRGGAGESLSEILRQKVDGRSRQEPARARNRRLHLRAWRGFPRQGSGLLHPRRPAE